MADDDNTPNPNDTPDDSSDSISGSEGALKDSNENIEALVEERVAKALKDIKGKLDKAYNVRDEALKEAAELKQKEKEMEISRLKEEGKHKEASEAQVADLQAKLNALEKRNIELTRDLDVRNQLGAFTFRSDKASEMAFKEIVAELVQDENGSWQHKSGNKVSDFIKSFVEDETNSFLFKQKESSGSGSTTVNSSSSSDTSKSIFDRSQDEVLKLAAEGKLRRG